MERILYSPEEVSDLINIDQVLLIDVRNAASYSSGHIAGAVNIFEVFSYLSNSDPKGLEELQKKFKDLFTRAGLSIEKTAIFYGNSLNAHYGGACRGYWLVNYLGHQKAGILHGGLDSWLSVGFALTTEKVAYSPRNFDLNIQQHLMATKDDVYKALSDNTAILLDDRDRDEWIGESSSPYGADFAPRKGRIPGAKWIEWYDFMKYHNNIPLFKSREEIQYICEKKKIFPENDIILYCFKGSRASNTYIALKLAGFKKIRIYFASWNEWSRDLSMPIEKGPPKST